MVAQGDLSGRIPLENGSGSISVEVREDYAILRLDGVEDDTSRALEIEVTGSSIWY